MNPSRRKESRFNKKRKESLTFEDLDNLDSSLDYRVFSLEHEFENRLETKKFAKTVDGEIYTQVDGEKDRVYSKGIHFVNNTGIYLVLFQFNPSIRN